MRMTTVFFFAILFVFAASASVLFIGGASGSEIYDAVERSRSGVPGDPATVEGQVSATATLSPLEGYTYPGQLDVAITFSDLDGTETVFDLHYPADYNQFHDGFGPLWLANWRPEIANNPQVTPVMRNTCLQTITTENLAPSPLYRTGYQEYLVCRVLDEEGPDAPRSYDISTAKPAVIGVIWANKNHQPMDMPRDRCIAEMRIWSSEVAKPEDKFMACVFVINEAPQQVEVYAFELTEDRITEVGGKSESWPRDPVKARTDAPRLAQYRLMQSWLDAPQTREAAVQRAFAHFQENDTQIVPDRISMLDSVRYNNNLINFTFSAKSDREMTRLRDKRRGTMDRHLFKHIRTIVCGTPERAALLAFQENSPTYTYDLNQRSGKPMTRYASFSNMPC